MAIIDYIRTLFGGKNFIRFFLACAWSFFAMWVIYHLLTHDMVGSAKEYGNTVLGFVMGTVIGTVVSFYFGSSQSSSDKDDALKTKQTN